MKKVIHWIDHYLEETLLVILLVGINCVMMLQVIMRYFFTPLTWPEEFTRFCFVASGFLSLGYCIRKNKLLKVDVVVGMMPPKTALVLQYLTNMISLAFYVYVFAGSFSVVESAWAQASVSPAMGFPMYLLYCTVTIGFFLAIVRGVQQIATGIWELRKKAAEEAKRVKEVSHFNKEVV